MILIKKLLNLFYSFAFIILLSSCGDSDTSINKYLKPQYKGRTLKMMSNIIGGKTPYEQKLFVDELERRLGFRINFFKPASGYDNIVLQIFSSGESYDLINMTSENLPIFIDQGALKNLTQIVKDSPVLSNPKVIPTKIWNTIKINNKIYGVPAKFEGGRLPIVRQDWLTEFDLDDPVTLDDWLEYWKMSKQKNNAYGLSTKGLYDVQPWASAFGLKDGYVIVKGKRTLPYASDKAADFWDWMAKVYRSGYLDPNFIVNQPKDFRNMFFANSVASVGYWDAWVGLFNNTEIKRYKEGKFIAKGIKGVPGPKGKIILTAGDNSLWVIPYNAKNIDMAIKFLEFWHSPPGYILGSVGIEGYDYTRDKNGKIVLTEIGIEHACDHGAPRVLSATWKPPFPPLPGVTAAQKIIIKYATPMYMPLDWADALQVIEYWSFKAIKGQITGTQAVKSMQKELKRKKLID